jgi:Peptidase_C39 like family
MPALGGLRWLGPGLLAAMLVGCATPEPGAPKSGRNHFMARTDFADFTQTPGQTPGEVVLTSPIFIAPNHWNELVASWNATPGVYLRIEARGIYPDYTTKYFTLGLWSEDDTRHPRESSKGQDDEDGTVKTDTLVLARPGANVQIRVTLGGGSGSVASRLKFLGLSFCDSQTESVVGQANSEARGKVLEVPERVQSGYDGPGGWCSPASVSMVLAYWSLRLGRPELDRPVPEVAAAVNDRVYGGAGNWPFNTAYAGSFPGMRAYVTRLDDLTELEDWIKAGIPPVMSVSSYLTTDRTSGPDNGHLIVCVGFTEAGDLVANDPGVSLRRGERPRRVYAREKAIEAWKKSKNTVYLIYPENAPVPRDRLGHWDDGRARH